VTYDTVPGPDRSGPHLTDRRSFGISRLPVRPVNIARRYFAVPFGLTCFGFLGFFAFLSMPCLLRSI
jgi:hypothetical protein